MKLLLTSAGLTNESIAQALQDLLGKPFADANLVFISTAANIEEGDKSWLIDDLARCKVLGFNIVDIVDIAALSKDAWLPRLEAGDVLLFGGGNTHYLASWFYKSGLAGLMEDLLKTRIYVGISAGSIAASKEMLVSESKLFKEENGQPASNKGLGLVNFQIRPHLNSPYFTKIRKDYVDQVAEELGQPMYVLDDQSALTVVDGKVEIVSEGEYVTYNLA